MTRQVGQTGRKNEKSKRQCERALLGSSLTALPPQGLWLLVVAMVLLCGVPLPASAFCGFYVSGADAKLYNDATVVVLMREGLTTVLSMQNNYQGPPQDFAMVIPVPVVLKKEQVKTLPDDVFERVDKMAAPRLVEYWEQDPCSRMRFEEFGGVALSADRAVAKRAGGDLGVKVEAKFDVDEYQIVILSAKDSTGLDTWLRLEKYAVPPGAEQVLRPYVAQGTKFFVAKVNSAKVRFNRGKAVLSPLRFHYESKEFSLPVRLGLLNSKGTQDLLVHILARGQRYDVANYDNVFIPTNLDVEEKTRKRFGEFYAALFDKTVAKHPKAVITEYAWDAGSCDPCPIPPLNPADLMTLGADVIGFGAADGAAMPATRRMFVGTEGFVLTRLHARYNKNSLGEDLVFRAAPPMVGGREVSVDGKQLEQGAIPFQINNFQARYAIRHRWKGKVSCEEPAWGIWGGPPGSNGGMPQPVRPMPADNIGSVARGKVQLASFLSKPLPELGLTRVGADAAGTTSSPASTSTKQNPAAAKSHAPTNQQSDDDDGCQLSRHKSPMGALWTMLLGVIWLASYRRRSSGGCRYQNRQVSWLTE